MHRRWLGHAGRRAAAAGSAFALVVHAAHGDGGPASDRLPGNDLDPAARGCFAGATEPISSVRPGPSRSPGGLLNFRAPASGSTGSLAACAELGVLAGDNDERAALFRRYRDPDGRAIVSSFGLVAEQADAALFAEAIGGSVARDDQYYALRGGRYNDWTLAAFFSETPVVYTSRYRSLWNGVGGPDLTLRSPALVPGGLPTADATQAALRGVLGSLPDSTLEVVRSKGGVSFGARWSESWRGFVSLATERRRGARPFGAVFGGGDGGGNVELPESIDDATHELRAGVSYADAASQLNVALAASMYRNRVDTMTFDNPLTVTLDSIGGIAAGALTRGRYDLAPDNDHTSVQADYARHWPQWLGARLTASASLGTMRQNGALVPPTALALSGATVNGVAAGGAWNNPAALTRASAEARIDTRSLALALALNPAPALAVGARYRHFATDNRTAPYVACNPLTGQVGRLLNDGSGAAVVDVAAYLAARCDLAAIRALAIAPDAGDVTVRNAPYEHAQNAYGVSADWRATRRSSVSADAEREEHRRPFRERARTHENRLRLGFTQRGFDADGGGAGLPSLQMLRASVEFGDRRGSAYVTDPYRQFVSAGLGPLPSSGNVTTWIRSVDSFRKFDLADRRQGRVDLRAGFALAEDLDAGVHVSGRQARYPDSEYGRNGRQDLHSAGVDVDYQAATGLRVHGFYAHQSGRVQQRGVSSTGCIIGAGGVTAANFQGLCGAAGGPLFPDDRAWSVRSRDSNHVAGAGARFELRRAVVDVDYQYARTRTAIDYAHGAGIVLAPAQQSLAGAGWPDLRFTQHVAGASALVPLTTRVAARLIARHERGRIDDWHYAGVAANPVPAVDTAYLDSGAESYRATFVGVLLRLSL